MTSEVRAAASRQNGAKSRGPKTRDGKRVAAQNARRHGLRAASSRHAPEIRERAEAILRNGITQSPELARELAEALMRSEQIDCYRDHLETIARQEIVSAGAAGAPPELIEAWVVVRTAANLNRMRDAARRAATRTRTLLRRARQEHHA